MRGEGPAPAPARTLAHRLFYLVTPLAFVALVAASLLVGGYDITLHGLITDPAQREMFFISRVPRTLALVFAGVAMSTSGVIMQRLTQNRFVEPTTAGTTAWAGLGMIGMILAFPAASPLIKMAGASLAAFAGTLLFMAMLRRVAIRSSIVVPLIGIMLGAIVGSVTTFIASQFDVLQTLSAWRSGGFSSVVRGFYEPLWAVVIVAILAWILADRFTAAGLGKELATGLGLAYERIVIVGVAMVGLCAGVTSVVVGMIPFLGLIVPNVVSIMLGDDVRKNLPWVAALGASLLIVSDLIGRVIIAPMEMPTSVVLGVVGAVVLLAFVIRRRHDAG